MVNINFELSERQTTALDLLFDNLIKEVLYGGGKGGGKSVFLCYFAVLYADWIIKLCRIKKSKYPTLLGFLGRLRAVDFNDTTLETWKKQIPSEIYEIRQQDKEIVLFGGMVKYHFGGLDNEDTVNKFNSAEYPLIEVDQAEELDRDQAARLRGTQGRTVINGIKVPCKILWTANPGECFLKDDFNPHNDPDLTVEAYRRFVQALASDNTFIDSIEYIKQLRDAWKHHPEILRAYVEGDWNSTGTGGFLIDKDTCNRLTKLELPQTNRKIWVSGDPAWLGEKTDEIVAYVFTDNRILDCSFKYNQETTTTAADWVKLTRQYGGNAIGVDAIGVGAGVTSDCRALVDEDMEVIAINSARPCIALNNKIQFANIRAEMYWTACEELKENKWILPNDPELIRQLCAIKYEIKNGKVKIEEKKDIKARLGRSPDRADAFVQGIWMKRLVKDVDLLESYDVEGESKHPYFRRRIA